MKRFEEDTMSRRDVGLPEEEPPISIIRLPEVMSTVRLSRSEIYNQIADGRFPKQVHLGGRSVGWVHAEIQTWLKKKLDARA